MDDSYRAEKYVCQNVDRAEERAGNSRLGPKGKGEDKNEQQEKPIIANELECGSAKTKMSTSDKAAKNRGAGSG